MRGRAGLSGEIYVTARSIKTRGKIMISDEFNGSVKSSFRTPRLEESGHWPFRAGADRAVKRR